MSKNSLYRELEVPVLTSHKAFAVLVTNVQNQQTIKENLIKGNQQYDYAFINAKNIVSLEQIYSAYYKTMLDNHHGTMKSRTLHTEVIYALSPFKNIMDCLNKFGISKSSDSLLILKIVNYDEATSEYFTSQLDNIRNVVDGEIVELNDENLLKIFDTKTIEKNYKLSIRGTPLENNPATITRNLVSITQLKGL